MSGHIVTITRNMPGRTSVSPVPCELTNTTRRRELRRFPALEGEGRAHRFDAADLAVLEPSMAAIELAEYLDKPAAWVADFRRAAAPFRPISTDEERDAIADARKSKDHSPSQREDLINKIRARSRTEQKRVWRECRKNAKRWIKLVRAYERDRAWLNSTVKDSRPRKNIVMQMAAGMRRAWANEIEAENQKEELRRARNRRETKKAAKQNRKAFGHKRKTDGWNSEFNQGQSFRKPATPLTPDGEVDVEAMKEAELLQLFASWQRSGENKGVGILQGLESEEGDQWSVTQQRREAQRLTRDAQKHKEFKRSRSV
jgi:hypothetical protein